MIFVIFSILFPLSIIIICALLGYHSSGEKVIDFDEKGIITQKGLFRKKERLIPYENIVGTEIIYRSIFSNKDEILSVSVIEKSGQTIQLRSNIMPKLIKNR